MTHETVSVESTDGISLAVHHLSDCEPGSLPAVLLSHATGFHGRCWIPVAKRLEGRFDVWAHDHRGYGDSTVPDDWTVRWAAFGDDALAAARYVATNVNNGPIIAAGHSMGGATLVMAALREPALFGGIVTFEPIIFPPSGFRPDDMPPNPLAALTRRRRAVFASLDEARENFASKPPMSSFHSDALEAYVVHGFRHTANGVALKCSPEHEARTYETGGSHETWNSLTSLTVPLWVVGSPEQQYQPSAIAPRIAEQVPGARYEAWSDVSHFGPMEDPDRLANFIAMCAQTVTRR
ncbi:MAG: alpha/beta hydrolase [Actinobacteria bacterium]|nr:alpha/beta hydrolase [Actinomycetota bacterium]